MRDIDVFKGKKLDTLEKDQGRKRLNKKDIPPGVVTQTAIESNALLIHIGLAADRPDGSTPKKCWFATDTGVLSVWDGSAWKTTTLS